LKIDARKGGRRESELGVGSLNILGFLATNVRSFYGGVGVHRKNMVEVQVVYESRGRTEIGTNFATVMFFGQLICQPHLCFGGLLEGKNVAAELTLAAGRRGRR